MKTHFMFLTLSRYSFRLRDMLKNAVQPDRAQMAI